MVRLIMVILVWSFLLSSNAIPQSFTSPPPDNSPGWAWLIEPMSPGNSIWSNNGVLGMITPACDGGIEVIIALKPADGSEYRVVVFDEKNVRHALRGLGSGSGDIALRKFAASAEVVPFAAVTSVGVEVLSKTGWIAASAAASKRAESAGVASLPLPALGQAFRFEFTRVDGSLVSSQRMLGNVVVVDCWATWCTPCMKKMPVLKELYEHWHCEGLEIVGVNYDQDQTKAQQAISDLELPWPQIFVPADQASRKLWWEVSSISQLPRLLLIDRSGNLILDSSVPGELEKALENEFSRDE